MFKDYHSIFGYIKQRSLFKSAIKNYYGEKCKKKHDLYKIANNENNKIQS